MTTHTENFLGKEETWPVAQAREFYNIAYWGSGYFDINDEGHVVVLPQPGTGAGVDLYRLSDEIRAAGLSLPVLVRFSGILHQRVDTLCEAFARAMAADNYKADYTAVYPIKVNQQRRVVEEIVRHGGGRVGLEAGSKPELMAVLALSGMNSAKGSIVICNGYKDREYIRLALIGKQLGHRVYIVVERLSELDLVIAESRALNIAPLIGVRVRLASIGAGKWQNTGGEKSKFGLSATQVLRVTERLRQAGMLDAFQLMHFHLGSQIANIRDIQLGMRECARYYAELRHIGVDLRCVDVGGGLGVDYDGTRSRNFCSMNYSVQEYADNVVHALHEICAEQNIPQPNIITESGRAMTAHHAMLITNVIDVEQAPQPAQIAAATADEHPLIQELWRVLDRISARSAAEAYHAAVHRLSEANVMFSQGTLDLAQRARIEQIYSAICWRARDFFQAGSRMQRELLDELNEKLADKYFCNFSLFQSMPDSWAIDQIFPIMPLHRLDERPTRRAALQDITCDSDGRIDLYVDGEGVETSLLLHPLHSDQPYLLGIFLLGAYQEILGDMHNLFGDTDSVHVELAADGGYRLAEPLRGDTAETVLRYVNFDAEDLLQKFRKQIETAQLTPDERQLFLHELREGLSGYTYLED
ncbi:MAG: biosynthetic arginine decarboxylase [Gammaproteobacteria bacterium]|nr:biosynthetic arginine decarboxylase [Gammaproteobacteria bacterium]